MYILWDIVRKISQHRTQIYISFKFSYHIFTDIVENVLKNYVHSFISESAATKIIKKIGVIEACLNLAGKL